MKETAKNVLVIIPAYNEADCIVATAQNVISAGYDYIVVNDGSVDGTYEVCVNSGLKVLNLPVNLGIGGAVQAGHMYAKSHGYTIDIQFDGDGQHDSRFLDCLVDEINSGADLVVGSRFISNSDGFKSTPLRRLGICWLSNCISLFTKKRIYDPTSGYRACGINAINLFTECYPVDYPEPESIVSAIKAGLTVKEIPVIMHERQAGTSSIRSFASIYYMIKVTLSIVIVSLFGRKCSQ